MKKYKLKSFFFLLVISFLSISATVVITQTNIFPDSGNVGLGTITPSEQLESKGNIYINQEGKGLVIDASNNKRFGFMKYSGKGAGIWRGVDQNFEIGRVSGNSVTAGLGNTPVTDFYVANTGNIGLGLTNPVTRLNIQQNGGLLRLYSGQNGGHTWMAFNNNGGPGSGRAGWIGYGNNGVTTMTIRNETANGDIQLYPKRHILMKGNVKGGLNGGATRFVTDYGFLDIGPKNQHYSHFYTDRPRYYFNKEIVVDSGKLSSHNESLRLSSKAWSMFFDINTDNVGSDYFQWRAKSQNIMRLSSDGNLCIGCDNATNRLDINGTARAKEIIVENTWADYVFTPEYKCPTLEEEAKSIETNGHLLGFQPEAEMNGEINIGAVTKAQQVKIEEMMLHLIEKDKQIERLEKLVERAIQIGPK